MISADLVGEDLAAGRPSARREEWDARYSGDDVWSGNPNGALVAEVATMDAGRALDIGAGEGGDAVWLAEQGWEVTATDISQRAIDRIDAVASERGSKIVGLCADAAALGPFERESFDLVTAHYSSIHRTADRRVIDNIVGAVAPGGTLLFVGHDPSPMRAAVDVDRHTQMFDPDAFVGVDDLAEALAGRDDWKIEVHEKRARPGGAASSHHTDDIVLRARRSPDRAT